MLFGQPAYVDVANYVKITSVYIFIMPWNTIICFGCSIIILAVVHAI